MRLFLKGLEWFPNKNYSPGIFLRFTIENCILQGYITRNFELCKMEPARGRTISCSKKSKSKITNASRIYPLT